MSEALAHDPTSEEALTFRDTVRRALEGGSGPEPHHEAPRPDQPTIVVSPPPAPGGGAAPLEGTVMIPPDGPGPGQVAVEETPACWSFSAATQR